MEKNLSIEETARRSVRQWQRTPPEEWGELLTDVLEALETSAEERGEMEAYDAALEEVQAYLERRILARQDLFDSSS